MDVYSRAQELTAWRLSPPESRPEDTSQSSQSSLNPLSLRISNTTSFNMKDVDIEPKAEIQKLIREPPRAALDCRIRLLAVEQTKWRKIGFHISKDTYQVLRNSFHLPATTLFAFSNISGTCYRALHMPKPATPTPSQGPMQATTPTSTPTPTPSATPTLTSEGRIGKDLP